MAKPQSKKRNKKYNPNKLAPQQTTKAASKKKKVLHVGCGQATKEQMPKVFRSDDWQEVRLDIDEKIKPDILGDIRDMPAVQTNSMNGVFSSHNLEHVFAHEVSKVMNEFFRVLAPGGIAVITMPDIQSIAFAVAEGRLEEPLYQSKSGPISPLDIIYGFGQSIEAGSHYMAHKTAFTAHTLGKKMLDAGFHNVKVSREAGTYNLWAHGYKPGGQIKESAQTAAISGKYAKRVVDLPKPGQLRDDLDAEPKIWSGLKFSN